MAAEEVPTPTPTEGFREAIAEEVISFFPSVPAAAATTAALPVAPPGRQGSVFKYPLQGLTGRYVLRYQEWSASGDNYYDTLTGTTDVVFPPASLAAFDPDTDYWFGGGDPLTDVLVMLTALGLGTFQLVTGVEGFLVATPYASDPGFIRMQFVEDTGNSATHYLVKWLDAATTWPVAVGCTDDDAPAAPQVNNGAGRALLTAQRPPEGVLRLEYPPTDDSLPRTPVVVGKARTSQGAVETAFFGTANDVRVLAWAALFGRVVLKAPYLDQAYSFLSVQELLVSHLAEGNHLRFYLFETQEPDDYWPCEGTPPMTQDYERSQLDKSKLKWLWRVELSYSAEA